MNINELRSKVWTQEKGNHKLTWKEVCKMTAEELQKRLDSGIKKLQRPDLICDVTEDGKLVLKKDVIDSIYKKQVDKMTSFDINRIRRMITENTPEGCTPDLSNQNIWETFQDSNTRTIKSKRETTTLVKICGCHVFTDGTSFFFDGRNYIANEKVNEKTDFNKYFTSVATPKSDLIQTCEEIGVHIITFDPEPIDQVILYTIYKEGLVEKNTGKRYFPIGLSASKARVGGVVWMVNANDWFEVEQIRAKVLHVDLDTYMDMMNKEVVIAKSETGSIGMRTSSVLNISKIAKMTKNSEALKNLKVKVVDDIKVMSRINVGMRITTEEGTMKPFTHKLLENEEIELIPSDGSSIMSLKAYMLVLHEAGFVSNVQYNEFIKIWTDSNYDVSILTTDPWMVRFFNGKTWKSLLQVRFFGGVKGTVIPVPQMDSDERCKDIDMIAFGKSVKYISNEAPFEVINYPHLNSAMLNYQFCQSTADNADLLIKGATKALEDTKKVLTDPAYACKFMGAIRNVNDGINGDEVDDQATKIANDLEVEPRLLNDVYHSESIKDRLDKFVKGISFGRIPVKGAYRYVISDPIFLYKKAMGEDFESELKAGQVYVDATDGYECGMWRSPMIHYSEPQRATCKDVDYLHIYKDIIILNPYDAIAPSLGGADFDGDKFLTVIDYKDGSFESDLVQAIQMPGYILMDDFGSAPKKINNIDNRLQYYVALSKKARVGQITNWATCVNDLRLNAEKNTKNYNWLNILLMTLRSSQMAEIDSVKTGITADGPDGDLMPEEYCNPKMQPKWFVELKKWQGRPLSRVNEYVSNSPMQKLYDFTMKFYREEILEGYQAKGILEVVGQTLTEEEVKAFASIKDIVASYEASYRQEMKQLITLKEKGCVDDKESEGSLFDSMKDRYRTALDSLIQGSVTSDVVAYACYYAANTRPNNNKITGKRSFPWFCYYAEMLNLLYRNGNSQMLVSLPDREMHTVEVKEGALIIDNNVFKTGVCYPEGFYGIIEIEGRPYIMVKRPRAPKIVKEISSNVEFMFSVSRFMKENQCVNSEELVNIIHNNDDVVDIVMDNKGDVNLVIDGAVYGLINNCPLPIIGKNVRIKSHSALTFIPKAVRSTTVMKNEAEAYSQYVTFNCTVVKGTDIKIEYDLSGAFSNNEYDEDGYRMYDEMIGSLYED